MSWKAREFRVPHSCHKPAEKATMLSLFPHLKELKKTVGKLLWDGWDVAFADVVPRGPVVRQRRCPGCQSHRECQGKDICLGQVAVLLQREGKGVRKEHLGTLHKGELGYELKKKQPSKHVYMALPSPPQGAVFSSSGKKTSAGGSTTNQQHMLASSSPKDLAGHVGITAVTPEDGLTRVYLQPSPQGTKLPMPNIN